MLAVDLRGGVLQHTASGVMKAVAEHNSLDVLVQNGLNVAAHVVAIGFSRLRADIKGCNTLVAGVCEYRLDALCMILGLMERPAADWY